MAQLCLGQNYHADCLQGNKQDRHCMLKPRTKCWPALFVAMVVVMAAAVNVAQLFTSRSCDRQLTFGVAAEPASVSCSFSNLSASVAPSRRACYPLDDSEPAVLDQAVLKLLREEQQHSHVLEDWLQLGNGSRSMLQCTSFSIPKVIHQTWVGKAPKPTKWINTFREEYVGKCPGWSYKLWTDDNLSELKHLDRSFFDHEGSFPGKSDILRAAILYEFGGVYIDADSQWVNEKCLDDILLLASDTGFFSSNEPGKHYAANGVFGAVRHHPVTRLYQQTQVTLSTGGRGGQVWQRLGPLAISAAMSLADNHAGSRYCTNSSTSKGRYFYPVYWHDHNMRDNTNLTNLTYVSEMVRAKYPEAVTYQFGFTTNSFKPKGDK